MEFKDYYQILGVPESASAEAIKKAYRKLARKYHPDVSKEADAADRMAEVNEAYTVLGDKKKRAAYDEVGAQAWARGARSGDDVRPPPGWNAGFGGGGDDSFRTHYGGDDARFSEFFEQMFGAGRAAGGNVRMRGEDRHARIDLDLVDAYRGAVRHLSVRDLRVDDRGQAVPETRTLEVRIPKGVAEGSLIRLAGHGGPGLNGGPSGDMLLEVHFRSDARWQVEGRDVTQRLRITPWEAARGADVRFSTPDGTMVDVGVPAGSGTGRKLRLKGRGIPSSGTPGDLYLKLEVAVPGAVTPEQKKAWEALAAAYPGFDPRAA